MSADKPIDIQKYEKGSLILNSRSNNNDLVRKDIEVPKTLLDAISKSIQKQPEVKEAVKTSSETGKSLYELVIKPDLQEGVTNGELVWKECSTEIRNASTGKYAGKVKLQKAEIPENNVTNSKAPNALSNITKSICSISGQIQLAEIAKKIDILSEKVDLIREEMWREKISDLNACADVIREALVLLPNDTAMNRINDSIHKLHLLSNFFVSTIESLLVRNVKYNLMSSFFEGLKFWELGKKDRPEYNNAYIEKIKELLGEYSSLVDWYAQSMGLLGTCYQTIHGNNIGMQYYDTMDKQIKNFSNEIFNKMLFLLDINHPISRNGKELKDIESLLNNRKIPIGGIISDSESQVKRINEMYDRLANQFDNTQIVIEIDANTLLKGE